MVKQPLVFSKNQLAKLIVWDKNHYAPMVERINYCLDNKEKLYVNYKKLCNDEKQKYCRAMLEPLKTLNKDINQKILSKYDNEMPLYIYWGIWWKNNIWAVLIHSKYKYNRSYIILDFSTYFEQITFDIVVNSLVKMWVANKKWAKIIAELWCIPKWKEIKRDWEKVIARWFSTSSRLAVFWSLKFFKNLKNLIFKELHWLHPEISVFVDDISISFDNINIDQIKNCIEKIILLADKDGFIFNKLKTKYYYNIDEVEILWVLVKRWNIEPTKTLKRKINDWFKQLSKAETNQEKKKIYKSINWLRQYKKNIINANKKKEAS